MQLNIAINQKTLIELAKSATAMELQDMAAELGYDKTRVTKWKNNSCRMSATEIAYFAEKAGIDFTDAVRELEIERDPRAAQVWTKLRKCLLSFTGIVSVLATCRYLAAPWSRFRFV